MARFPSNSLLITVMVHMEARSVVTVKLVGTPAQAGFCPLSLWTVALALQPPCSLGQFYQDFLPLLYCFLPWLLY